MPCKLRLHRSIAGGEHHELIVPTPVCCSAMRKTKNRTSKPPTILRPCTTRPKRLSMMRPHRA